MALSGAIFLLGGLVRLRSFVVDSEGVGWRLGPLAKRVAWDSVQRADWPGLSFFPRLRLCDAKGCLTIPFTVAGYAHLYLRIAERARPDAFTLPKLPFVIKKPKNWNLYFAVPLTLFLVLGAIVWGVGLASSSTGLGIALAVLLVSVALFSGLGIAWLIVQSHEDFGDVIEFNEYGIREVYQETGHQNSWSAGEITAVSLGEAHSIYRVDLHRLGPRMHQPNQSVRVTLATGDSIEIPSTYLGFRADKLAHTLSKAYGVPLSAYKIDLIAKAEESVQRSVQLQTLDISGHNPTSRSRRRGV